MKRGQSKVSQSRSNRPELVLQRGHSQGINCAAYSPDGRWIGTGANDNSIVLWQTDSGRQLRTLNGHRGYIRSIAISSDGKLIASGSNDRTVRVWEVQSGRELAAFDAHDGPVTSIVFHPNGQWLVSGGVDKTIKIWDLSQKKELRTLKNHTASVTALAFNQIGTVLVSAAGNEAIVWDTHSWTEQRTFRRHTAEIVSLAFSQDGNVVASGSVEGSVLVWRVGSDRESLKLTRNSTKTITLRFASDASLTAIHADGGFTVWDTNTGNQKRSVPGDAAKEELLFASLSPNNETFTSGTGRRLAEIKTTESGALLRTLNTRSTPVNSLAFSPDGRWFAAANNDSSVRLWQVATGRELPRLMGHSGYVTTVAFSPDSRFFASGSRSGEVKLWDVYTTQLVSDLRSRGSGINSLAFNPNGKSLAVVGMDHDVELWDLATKQVRRLSGHSKEITSVSFQNENIILTAGRDQTIKVWDLRTGNNVKTLDNQTEINAVALNPSKDLLATANVDNTASIWNLNDGRMVQKVRGHSAELYSVCFNPGGTLLATAGADQSVVISSLSGNLSATLKGSLDSVASVIFTPDGRWLLSGNTDGSILVWDANTKQQTATLVSLPDGDDWLVTTPDGLFDGSPESWNAMLWRFDGGTFNVLPVESYFNEFYYPGLLAEILAGANPKADFDIANKDRRQPDISLKVGPTHSERQVVVNLGVTAESGAQDVRLFRNGLLVKTWTGDVLHGNKSAKLQTSVPVVAGDNNFTAYAFNSDNIKSLDAKTIVHGVDSLKRQGTAYLLMIGVEQYQNSDFNLKYPVADASTMEAEFQAQQQKVGRYNPVVTITLTNTQATKANILLALALLSGATTTVPAGTPAALRNIKPAQPEDAVLIYFSGHGMAVNGHFYVIPYDVGYMGQRTQLKRDGVKQIVAHSVSDEELEAALQPLDADQLLLVVDACYSGQAIDSNETRRGPMNTKGLAQLAYEKGMYILTASQSIEVAFETDAFKHSYLAYALLEEGIKAGEADENHDGKIFLNEWFGYANSRVPQIRRKRLEQRKELVEDEPDEQKVQRPRVFYTRETGAKNFLVATLSN